MNKAGIIGGTFIAIVLAIAVIMVFMCVTTVPAGYVAVQYNINGGIQEEVLTQGWHIVPPNIKTTLYTIALEQSYLTSGNNGDSPKNESFSASSSEGKDIQIDLTFTYQFQADRISEVFTYFKGSSGTSLRDSFIKPNIISWTKEVIAKYKVADIIGSKRASINSDLTVYLAEKFDKYGITISNVSLINIEVDADTTAAINAKIAAQQNAETQVIINQTNIERAEAEASVLKTNAQAQADAQLIQATIQKSVMETNAEAEASALLIQAKAHAEAQKINAEAQAEYQRMVQETMTTEMLQNYWINRWDGKLPNFVGNSNDVLLGINGDILNEAD